MREIIIQMRASAAEKLLSADKAENARGGLIKQWADELETRASELKAELNKRRDDYNEEIDEFNAGYDAGVRGDNLNEAECKYALEKYGQSSGKCDVFAPGYAWGAFGGLKSRVAELESCLRLKLAVAADDPVLVDPLEKRLYVAQAARARLAAALNKIAFWGDGNNASRLDEPASALRAREILTADDRAAAELWRALMAEHADSECGSHDNLCDCWFCKKWNAT